MTKKQITQFNLMLAALRTISKDYQTPSQLKRSAEKQFGLDYEEALEMSYENIQALAAKWCKGVKPIPMPEDAKN